MVDRFLVEQIVAGPRSGLRDQIARELSSDAPLVRHGVVQVEPGPVRAAFLAAHEGQPLCQEHLLRAVQLEYREMGKLSTSSRLE